VGAAKVPLRAVTGLAGGVSGARSGTGIWKGAVDGYRNPSLNVKEAILNSAQARAAAGTGITSILAGRLAAKIDKPKNSAGETREDLEKRITAKAKKDEENRTAAIEKVFKLATQEDWMKKNQGKTIDDYKNHAEDLMKKKAEALMGKEMMNKADSRDAAGRTHYQIMMANAFKDVTDASGKRTVAVNERKATDVMLSALTHHTTGDGKRDLDLTSARGRLEFHSRMKALAKVKVLESSLKTANKAAASKEEVENHIERLKAEIDMIQKLPSVDDINAQIATKGKYDGPGKDKKEIRKINETWDDFESIDRKNPKNTPEKIAKIERAHQKALDDYAEHLEKQKGEIIKIQDRLAAKNKQKEEQKEAPKK
jgi:hypothetical protein